MKTLSVLYHLGRADFFERTRRTSFLLTLAAIIYLGVLVINGMWFLYVMGGGLDISSLRYRGEFNSAWIGTMTVMVTNLVLGLFGFYLVSDCIARDIRTGVGQIIATTPVRRVAYLVGKWISNCLVLFVLVLILAAAAVIMVLLKSDTALDLGALLMPFLAITLPNMALIAALAVFFETVPWLRGVVGNVVYFFLWLLVTIIVIVGGMLMSLVMDPTGANLTDSAGVSLPDPMGISLVRTSLVAGAKAAFPDEAIGGLMGLQAGLLGGTQFRVFNWSGVDWTPGIVAGQWFWVVIGLGLILLSALWFARFDPSREGLRLTRRKPETAKDDEPAEPEKKALRLALPSLSPLISRVAQVSPFLGVLFAELRLLLNGRRWWWWAITAGLNILILTSSPLIARQYLLPFAWLWLLAILPGMGNRERKNNTAQMVFSSARPVLRQLPAAWLAGFLATALLVIGGAVFFLINGDLPALAGWAAAVIFVPTLALALGVLSSGSRVFEVVYLIWWYIGPLQKTPGLNFTNGAPQVYLAAAAGLLLLSAYLRSRQVRV
jgi:hypothetical protein